MWGWVRFELTLYRPAMPLGKRKFYFRGSFQFSIIIYNKLHKKYRPSKNLKIVNLGIFSKLKISFLNGKNPSNFSEAKFHFKYFGLLWVKKAFFSHYIHLSSSVTSLCSAGCSWKSRLRHFFSSGFLTSRRQFWDRNLKARSTRPAALIFYRAIIEHRSHVSFFATGKINTPEENLPLTNLHFA